MSNFYGLTDKGGREKNEDWIDSFEIDGTLFSILIDGFGIEDDSNSNLIFPEITDKARGFIKKFYVKGMDPTIILNQGVYLANLMTMEYIKKEEYKKCGASIIICAIYEKVLYISHVGINRAYLIRGDNIYQGTEDDNEAQLLLNSGQITKEEYEEHPKRNLITNGLGKNENINIKNSSVNLQKGDIVLLLSDGIYRVLGDENIKKVVMDSGDIETASKWLIEAATEHIKSPDNISAIVSYIGN